MWGGLVQEVTVFPFPGRCRLPAQQERALAEIDTPLMQPYREVKGSHLDALVLFRVGDFFELFGSDAEVGARVLGLALTSRDKGTPMAGFPHHALDAHVCKLVRAGQRVAVCDLVEEPTSASGLVRRAVVRVLTPGTLTDGIHVAPDRTGLR
jgi:DNA mismatch repair protein MutS